MRQIINGINKLKSSTEKILSKINHNTYGKDMKYTFEQKFQRVECYDVTTKNKINSHKFDNLSYKLEKEDPSMITLNDKQKEYLRMIISKSYEYHHKGKIQMSPDTLIKYKNMTFALENNTQISKACLDYVIADIINNINSDPLQWQFGDISVDEEIDNSYSTIKNCYKENKNK